VRSGRSHNKMTFLSLPATWKASISGSCLNPESVSQGGKSEAAVPARPQLQGLPLYPAAPCFCSTYSICFGKHFCDRRS
jgi:hypothetical protein